MSLGSVILIALVITNVVVIAKLREHSKKLRKIEGPKRKKEK